MALAGLRPQRAPARTRRAPGRTLIAARWLLLPALVLVFWELAVGLGWLRPFSFPPPSRLASVAPTPATPATTARAGSSWSSGMRSVTAL